MSLERFILGTVQLGMPYGINNQLGQPSLSEANEIISEARNLGILKVDTADAYGQSSDILGAVGVRELQVLSKFIFSSELDSIASLARNSLGRLKTNYLYAYSFHRFGDYATYSNWSEVEQLKDQGLVKHIGISLYSNEELAQVIEDPHINLIQLPFNLLDNWSVRGDLLKKAADVGKIIHTRSIYLQGLFFRDVATLPASLEPIKPCLHRLQDIAKDARLSIAELCLGYVLSKTEIEGLVIGLESVEQLRGNAQIFNSVKIDKNVIREIEKIHVPTYELLNPGNWK